MKIIHQEDPKINEYIRQEKKVKKRTGGNLHLNRCAKHNKETKLQDNTLHKTLRQHTATP